MFTGIIQALGTVRAVSGGSTRSVTLTAPLPESALSLGSSIAVQGVCLTVRSRTTDGFCADVSAETLARTTLGALRPGDEVHLEPALTLSDRLGGHLVSGHVDGLGRLRRQERAGSAQVLWFDLPRPLQRYVAHKGSICIDGVSLTVNALDADGFNVTIVPHTAAVTTLARLVRGASVNIEVDLIARYLERLIGAGGAAGSLQDLLQAHGWGGAASDPSDGV